MQINIQLFEIEMRFLTGDELLPDGWWYLGDWGASSGRRGLESHRPENRKLIWHMAQTQREPHKSESRMYYVGGRSDKPFTQPPARLVFPSPVSAPRQNCGSVRCLLWIMFDTMPGPMKRAGGLRCKKCKAGARGAESFSLQGRFQPS